MELPFEIEILIEVCAKIRMHPVLVQLEKQLIDLILM